MTNNLKLHFIEEAIPQRCNVNLYDEHLGQKPWEFVGKPDVKFSDS